MKSYRPRQTSQLCSARQHHMTGQEAKLAQLLWDPTELVVLVSSAVPHSACTSKVKTRLHPLFTHSSILVDLLSFKKWHKFNFWHLLD